MYIRFGVIKVDDDMMCFKLIRILCLENRSDVLQERYGIMFFVD